MAAVWLASGRQEAHRRSAGDMLGGWTYVYEIVGMNPADADAQACWDEFYDRAVAILEARWDSVEAVAAALLADGSIGRRPLLSMAR